MSPSCCGGHSGSNDHLSLNESIAASNNAQLNHASEETACCTGSECGCDEGCIEQLARAICAEDDGHIHPPTPQDGRRSLEAGTDSSEDTCKCEDAGDKDLKASTVDTSDNSTLSSVENIHTCGLRKRKTPAKKGGLPKEACGEHKSLAKNRYKDTLSAFGCVCRAMLARGVQSCCTAPRPIPTSFSHSLVRLHNATKSKLSVNSCGGGCCGSASVKSRSRTSIDTCAKDRCCEDSCCGRSIGSVKSSKPAAMTSCCSGGGKCTAETGSVLSLRRTGRASVDSCCVKSCCASSIGIDADIEKRSCVDKEERTGTQHAVLAVKGMTCTGCENKLIRALRAQPAISNIKTSLVLSRAEFDYSGDVNDIEVLIVAIQKRTGFTTEQVDSTSAAHILDLSVEPSLQSKLLLMTYPDGVQQVAKLGKNTVRVVYDPHVIGARDVLSSYAAYSPALAPEPQDPALAAGAKHIKVLVARTIISSALTIPVLVMAWAPLPIHSHAYAISSLVLATLVQVCIAGPFYQSALKSLLFSGLVETDLLIVLSTTTAYVYSVVAFAFNYIGRPLNGGSFFETSTLLVTLIMWGQLASAFARQRAVAAISLRSLQEQTAILVLTQWDGRMEEKTIDARLLHYDDIFRVHPDSVIITDGAVVSGTTSVNESMMTGEALPVEKSVGSEVLAGTTNGAGSLLVKVTRLSGENTISEIANMVDDARFSRARIQSIVDRICTWFVPTVLTIAIITFVVWILVGICVRKQSAGSAAVKALTYAIAVLAISCPCAVGLAVPMVVLVASGVAARLGLVFKAATTIETAKNITHVVFDKTGTLTMGLLEVVHADLCDLDAELKSAVLSLASSSKHPVARAVATYLALQGISPTSSLEDTKEITGKGVEGSLVGHAVCGGNAKWLELEEHPLVVSSLSKGLSTFCVTVDGALRAVFGLSDTIREEVPTVLAAFSARNIKVSILSGDHAAAVDRVALALGIPPGHVSAGCLPADKAAYIRELQAGGEKVMFCGDGTNDSVALAQADIGVHMSSESSSTSGAAASSASDAVLLRPSLTGLISFVELSEAVHRRIVLNFAWSAVYNLVAILFAAGAFVNARISPAYAGLGELVSVLPVIMVALQLKWFRGTV